jgi:hypothetical protein
VAAPPEDASSLWQAPGAGDGVWLRDLAVWATHDSPGGWGGGLMGSPCNVGAGAARGAVRARGGGGAAAEEPL